MNEPPPSRRPRIKVCGITRADDAIGTVDAGVELIGLNFYPPSPRSVTADRARDLVAEVVDRRGPKAVTWVGVFVDQPVDEMLEIAERVGLDLLQCHGDESPEQVARISERAIQAFRVDHRLDPLILGDWLDLGLWGLLVDSRHPTLYGGTGEGWDFGTLGDARAHAGDSASPTRWLIAGGLGPDNVVTAAAAARPWGVDLASGVESAPGIKNLDRVRRLVAALDGLVLHDASTSASFPHEEIDHGESRSTA